MSENRIKRYCRRVREEINRQDAEAARVKRQNEIKLEEQAMERLLRRLHDIDPLTARRLALVFEWEVTMDELIAMEDRGIEELASLLIEQAKQRNALPENGN